MKRCMKETREESAYLNGVPALDNGRVKLITKDRYVA